MTHNQPAYNVLQPMMTHNEAKPTHMLAGGFIRLVKDADLELKVYDKEMMCRLFMIKGGARGLGSSKDETLSLGIEQFITLLVHLAFGRDNPRYVAAKGSKKEETVPVLQCVQNMMNEFVPRMRQVHDHPSIKSRQQIEQRIADERLAGKNKVLYRLLGNGSYVVDRGLIRRLLKDCFSDEKMGRSLKDDDFNACLEALPWARKKLCTPSALLKHVKEGSMERITDLIGRGVRLSAEDASKMDISKMADDVLDALLAAHPWLGEQVVQPMVMAALRNGNLVTYEQRVRKATSLVKDFEVSELMIQEIIDTKLASWVSENTDEKWDMINRLKTQYPALKAALDAKKMLWAMLQGRGSAAEAGQRLLTEMGHTVDDDTADWLLSGGSESMWATLVAGTLDASNDAQASLVDLMVGQAPKLGPRALATVLARASNSAGVDAYDRLVARGLSINDECVDMLLTPLAPAASPKYGLTNSIEAIVLESTDASTLQLVQRLAKAHPSVAACVQRPGLLLETLEALVKSSLDYAEPSIAVHRLMQLSKQDNKPATLSEEATQMLLRPAPKVPYKHPTVWAYLVLNHTEHETVVALLQASELLRNRAMFIALMAADNDESKVYDTLTSKGNTVTDAVLEMLLKARGPSTTHQLTPWEELVLKLGVGQGSLLHKLASKYKQLMAALKAPVFFNYLLQELLSLSIPKPPKSEAQKKEEKKKRITPGGRYETISTEWSRSTLPGKDGKGPTICWSRPAQDWATSKEMDYMFARADPPPYFSKDRDWATSWQGSKLTDGTECWVRFGSDPDGKKAEYTFKDPIVRTASQQRAHEERKAADEKKAAKEAREKEKADKEKAAKAAAYDPRFALLLRLQALGAKADESTARLLLRHTRLVIHNEAMDPNVKLIKVKRPAVPKGTDAAKDDASRPNAAWRACWRSMRLTGLPGFAQWMPELSGVLQPVFRQLQWAHSEYGGRLVELAAECGLDGDLKPHVIQTLVTAQADSQLLPGFVSALVRVAWEHTAEENVAGKSHVAAQGRKGAPLTVPEATRSLLDRYLLPWVESRNPALLADGGFDPGFSTVARSKVAKLKGEEMSLVSVTLWEVMAQCPYWSKVVTSLCSELPELRAAAIDRNRVLSVPVEVWLKLILELKEKPALETIATDETIQFLFSEAQRGIFDSVVKASPEFAQLALGSSLRLGRKDMFDLLSRKGLGLAEEAMKMILAPRVGADTVWMETFLANDGGMGDKLKQNQKQLKDALNTTSLSEALIDCVMLRAGTPEKQQDEGDKSKGVVKKQHSQALRLTKLGARLDNASVDCLLQRGPGWHNSPIWLELLQPSSSELLDALLEVTPDLVQPALAAAVVAGDGYKMYERLMSKGLRLGEDGIDMLLARPRQDGEDGELISPVDRLFEDSSKGGQAHELLKSNERLRKVSSRPKARTLSRPSTIALMMLTIRNLDSRIGLSPGVTQACETDGGPLWCRAIHSFPVEFE